MLLMFCEECFVYLQLLLEHELLKDPITNAFSFVDGCY